MGISNILGTHNIGKSHILFSQAAEFEPPFVLRLAVLL
jgi:hypothetical protein